VVWIGGVIRFAIALGTSVVVAALFYFIGPNRPRKTLRNAWPGAIVATVLWFAATSAFAWYVRNLARYNVLYGSIATAIALMVWMYLLALIALLGCEFNAERERLRAAMG
jgi:membrane protein